MVPTVIERASSETELGDLMILEKALNDLDRELLLVA